MMKSIILLLAMILFVGTADAFLGTYVEGDNVSYGVTCHTDEGNVDSGCSTSNASIKNPYNTAVYNQTMSETSDADEPGAWYAIYTVNSSAKVGTWKINIRLTNSNGTIGGTTLQFQVVESDSGLGNLSDKLDTKATTGAVQSVNNTVKEGNGSTYQYFTSGSNEDAFKSNATVENQNALISGQTVMSTDLNSTDQYKSNATVEKQNEILAGMITNASAVKENTSSEVDRAIAYILGLNNISVGDVWTYATRTINRGNISGGNLTTPNDYKCNATGEKQNEILAGMIVNTTFIKTTIQGLNNITAADVWSVTTRTLTNASGVADDIWAFATRALTTPDDYKCNATVENQNSLISGQAVMSSDLNNTDQYKSNATIEKQNTIEADTSEIQGNQSRLITATGFETETVAKSRYENLTTDIGAINVTVEDIWAENLSTNKSADDTITYIYDDIIYGGGS